MRKLLWQSDAWNEYIDIQTDKALLKRTNKLIKDIIRNGYDCSYGKVVSDKLNSPLRDRIK